MQSRRPFHLTEANVNPTDEIRLTAEECRAVHRLIAELSGDNPEYAFAWDGTDSMADPRTAACVKIYRAAGRPIPPSCQGA